MILLRCRQWLHTLRPVTGAKSEANRLCMPMSAGFHHFCNEATQCAQACSPAKSLARNVTFFTVMARMIRVDDDVE